MTKFVPNKRRQSPKKNFTVSIEQKHIYQGRRCDEENCALSLAIIQQLNLNQGEVKTKRDFVLINGVAYKHDADCFLYHFDNDMWPVPTLVCLQKVEDYDPQNNQRQ